MNNSGPDSVGRPGAASAPFGVTVYLEIVRFDVYPTGYKLTSSHRDMSVSFLRSSSRYSGGGGRLGALHDVVVIVRLQVVHALRIIGARFGSAFHSATFENALSGPNQALGATPDIPQEYALVNS